MLKKIHLKTLLFSLLLMLVNSALFAYSPPPVVTPGDEVIDDPCYPGSALDHIPDLALPPDESWNRWETGALIVTQGAPYHMVHDLAALPGQEHVVVGKFDYGTVFHKDLELEDVHVYIYGTGFDEWDYLGRYTTDWDGKVYASIPDLDPGEYMVRMVVAGDLTEALGYISVVEPGREAVVFDIDGTLTTNDFEVVGDYTNVSQAQAYAYSKDLVYLYKSKGYMVIFLTARPYWVARDTREWYSVRDYPETTLTHFALSNEESMDAAQYKTEYLNYLKSTASVSIIRAYGNATSDIEAFDNAGIPKSETYIIGSNAGASGTNPINTDYKNHYNWVKTILDCCDH